MATAPAPRFTESFETQIDDLLMRICADLQLDETRHELADASYRSVGEWLESQDAVARLSPAIYPQGSMLLGTTVRPLSGEEYDLDFVCEFVCGTSFFRAPAEALNLIERALRANAGYSSMVERKNRCIRLNYARKFHMDILPACKDPLNGANCILVPDRRLGDWTPSNPRGYGSWFTERARQQVRRVLLDKAAPIPGPENLERKSPLKLCVQLWKRWRDVRYKDRPDLAPISIVITTLAGLIYRGEQSIMVAMANILEQSAKVSQSSAPRLVVLNPSNRGEDLSERWQSKPAAYREFVLGVAEFYSEWKELSTIRGIDKVARKMERLFGEEIAKQVVEKQAREIEKARAEGTLGMKRSSGIITSLASTSAIPVRPNVFYGDEK